MRAAILFGLFAAHAAYAQVAQPPREHIHFPPGAIWTQDISGVTPASNSATMTSESVGWGTGGAGGTQFQMDWSMHLLYTSWAGYSFKRLLENSGYYTTDCESDYPFPVPPEGTAGAVEGAADYSSCDYSSDDCHMSVVLGNTLYESYQTGVDSNGLHSTCVVKWHLNLVYPPEGRGEGCTSADAAGFPIGTMLFSPDDVFAAMQVSNGDLGHALRFTLPNNRMRAASYVHPASHNGAPNSSNANAIPYGARLRLKSTFAGGKTVANFSTNEADRVILRTLQKYGMFLSDGGNIPLIADDGMFSTKKWDDLNVGTHDLFGIALGDFDVMPLGTVIHYDNNAPDAECDRNHFGDDVIFSDGLNW